MAGLSVDEIQKLLAKRSSGDSGRRISPATNSGPYSAPPQYGPLRWCDDSFRCASRGCASPTVLKVDGIPRCGVHALRILNEMVIELTGGRNGTGESQNDLDSSVELDKTNQLD